MRKYYVLALSLLFLLTLGTGALAAQTMVLTSVSGDATLLLPKNISTEIDARTTSGRISSEFKIMKVHRQVSFL